VKSFFRVIALEAAHIKWFQAGGPDVEQNGLALRFKKLAKPDPDVPASFRGRFEGV
jgi:hypothetical protein